jgi:hypothetical protein
MKIYAKPPKWFLERHGRTGYDKALFCAIHGIFHFFAYSWDLKEHDKEDAILFLKRCTTVVCINAGKEDVREYLKRLRRECE